MAEILEAIEQHLEALARVGGALQALNRRFDELRGEPHDAVVFRMDARPGADEHHQHEGNQRQRQQRHEQGIEPKTNGHS
ncbi:hypothetical protein [Hyphomicrobium sp.]|uniref:hypothetical protein n=1 Tax=Hyphomicrobium sp. TaxID=82 RepID=UPI0025C4829F|nr:hypothetical protein [Hyphomicrobium sp.]